MTWSNVPLTAPALATKAAMDEVKAAFDERYDAVGASFGKPNAVTAGDLMDWSATIAHYHTKIESLLGSFYQKSGSGESTTFAAYTKSSLLTECFSQTEWRDTAAGLATIRQVNDLRTVLDKLEWVQFSVDSTGGECDRKYMDTDVDVADWETCKSNAWSALVADTPDTISSQISLRGGHAGWSAKYSGYYRIAILYYLYNSQISFDTSSLSGLTLSGGYLTAGHCLTHNSGTISTYETCSCNIKYETSTIKSNLSITTVYPTITDIAMQISSIDTLTNKSGLTYAYMDLNDPGDDASDRETSWPAAVNVLDSSRYSRMGNLGSCKLNVKIQFSYRAA